MSILFTSFMFLMIPPSPFTPPTYCLNDVYRVPDAFLQRFSGNGGLGNFHFAALRVVTQTS